MAKHCTRECPDGETECCIYCSKSESCGFQCDDMDSYEFAEDCPEYVEPWELPCRKCKRNSKDYWRKKCDLDE